MDIPRNRLHGTVCEFDRIRGRGTIEFDNGQRASVRYSAIVGQGLRMLRSGDHVSFDVEQNQRGLNAVRVTVDQG